MELKNKLFRNNLTAILIIAILNFLSCSSLEVISIKDLDEGKAQIDFSEELYLTTKDSTIYHFLPANFQMVNDTLYGKGTIEHSSQMIPFQGSIALQDIISFEQSTPNTLRTVGLGVGIVAIGLFVLTAVFAVALATSISAN